jgi:YebC/PmpR family DNA-binding regulatory protein
MAGHSHSANIAVRKGKQDVARAKLFSKLSRYIIIAARNGGGDPDTNLRLRYAIVKARAVSMPRENIERAVKKGTGELEGAALDEVSYEGYAPGGVAILVEGTTDNRNRTSGEVRSAIEKAGGSLGTPGCVSYLFDRKGLIVLDAGKYPDEDAVMAAALDAGADDVRKEGDVYEITSDPTQFTAVLDSITKAGFETVEAEVKNLAKTYVDVDVEAGKKIVRLIQTLDANDDVSAVYTNANLTDEMAVD